MRTTLVFVSFFLFSLALYAQEEVLPDATTMFDSVMIRDFAELVSRRAIQPFAKAESFNKDNLKVSSRLGNHKAAGVAANNLGWIALRKKDYPVALQYFERAVKEFTKGNSKKGVAAALGEMGMVHRLTGNDAEGLLNYLKALKLMEENGMKRGIAVVSNAIAQIYSSKKEHEKALGYFRKSIGEFSSLKDNLAVSDLNLRIGEELIKLSRDEEALPVLNAALRQKEELKDNRGRADGLRDLGIIQYRKGNYQQALQLFQSSLKLYEQLPVLKLVRDTYLKLSAESELNNERKKTDEYKHQYHTFQDSVQKLLASRSLSPDSNAKEMAEKEKISDLVTMQKEFQVKNLDVGQIERNRKLTDAELERLKDENFLSLVNKELEMHEFADQERMNQIEQLQKEKATQELALSQKQLLEEKQKKVIYGLIGGVALVMVSLSFIYYRYHVNKKSHEQLDKAYSELTNAHGRLKSMQTQLVHAEKMASLGELTAGIAHEIQNPLNFVNNFAEISKELIEEIGTAESETEMQEMMGILKGNLEKINYHGKRADSIVKSMLQHSRSGSSDKQPTDVNKLCAEYLNLAYHGMRANDSSFNCTVEKHLDENIPVVNLIPQDFSRVMLNLFNNAFYSVREKNLRVGAEKQSESNSPVINLPGNEPEAMADAQNGSDKILYKPMIKVVTQTLNHSVLIRVRDNGIGIPDEIKEKVFTPFFTTKPTGQGTGLGMSISRDIIVAHGGEISINNEIESGAEILIRLPIT